MAKKKVDKAWLWVKVRFRSGMGSKAIRESFNALAALTPEEVRKRAGHGWEPISGHAPLTAQDTHRIQSSLGRKVRAERKYTRWDNRRMDKAEIRQNEMLGIPPPERPTMQQAQDAGTLYRYTNDEEAVDILEERYRDNEKG